MSLKEPSKPKNAFHLFQANEKIHKQIQDAVKASSESGEKLSFAKVAGSMWKKADKGVREPFEREQEREQAAYQTAMGEFVAKGGVPAPHAKAGRKRTGDDAGLDSPAEGQAASKASKPKAPLDPDEANMRGVIVYNARKAWLKDLWSTYEPETPVTERLATFLTQNLASDLHYWSCMRSALIERKKHA